MIGIRGVFGALAACALVLLPAAPAAAEDPDDVSIHVSVPDEAAFGIDDAELRWGINQESGSGAFAGGCNFLSAGTAGDAGGAREWTEAEGLYRARAGDVRIVKADADGDWVAADWDTRCLDRHGVPVRAFDLSSHTETQVVMTGGVGSRAADGSVTIRWTGSFTVAYYGGMTYWSVIDPVLTMDAAGNGRLVARLSGYATSQSDLGKWEPVTASNVVLAEIRDAPLHEGGFARVPEYLGVRAAISGQVARDSANTAHWGAFPASFLRFQESTGQAGYWMTTGGQRDPAKVPSMLYVNLDAADPAVVPSPVVPPSGGAPIENAVVQRPRSGGTMVANPTEPAATGETVAVSATTVSASDGALVPTASGAVSAVALPALATALAGLVALLAALDLGGVSIRWLPWRIR